MIIKVSNNINNQTITFLGYYEWKKEYPACKDVLTAASRDNTYQLMTEGLSGFFTLPANNTNSNQGIDQDGTLFLNNYYSDRLLTWQFNFVNSGNIVYMTSTLYQNNALLDIEVIFGDKHFYTRGTLNGTVEEGAFDISCEPFFNTGSKVIEELVIPFEDIGTGFLPFTLPTLLFDWNKPDGFNTLEVTTLFEVEPIITIRGKFKNLSLNNLTSGSKILVEGWHTEIIMDSVNNDLYIDGELNNETYRGVLPSLIAGTQVLEVDWFNRFSEITMTVEYYEMVGACFT